MHLREQPSMPAEICPGPDRADAFVHLYTSGAADSDPPNHPREPG